MSNPKCGQCGNTHLLKDDTRGELVCNKCGTVVTQDELDTAPEWRAFDPQQQAQRTRTGAPLTFTKHDKGIATEIGKVVRNEIAHHFGIGDARLEQIEKERDR